MQQRQNAFQEADQHHADQKEGLVSQTSFNMYKSLPAVPLTLLSAAESG